MPRHLHPDVHRPVQDNVAHAAPKAAKRNRGMDTPHEGKPSHSPQASSLPGSLPVILDVSRRGGAIVGIPGIISSTTTSPETRQRLVSGILDMSDRGSVAQGPVHTVMGHDATAYNAGMVHIRGSHY